MSTCFVIQPFDGATYDKRYTDVLAPAILAAGLEPYRVDRDQSATVLISMIEEQISNASAVVADITEDNPNVWYELGFAIASEHSPVMICSEKRARFPFDIQHRMIVRYKTESTSDFEYLSGEITGRLKTAVEHRRMTTDLSQRVVDVRGLTPHSVAALVILGENAIDPDSGVTGTWVQREMERAGYTRIAATLALRELRKAGLVVLREELGEQGQEFIVHDITSAGLDWLEAEQEALQLVTRPAPSSAPQNYNEEPF